MRRPRDQLLTFAALLGRVEDHINACERELRPTVIQLKNTNGYRAMWSAKGEAAVRTVVATTRMTSGAGTFSTLLANVDLTSFSQASHPAGLHEICPKTLQRSVQ